MASPYNAARRDAGTVECRDDFYHGLLCNRIDHFEKREFPEVPIMSVDGTDAMYSCQRCHMSVRHQVATRNDSNGVV